MTMVLVILFIVLLVYIINSSLTYDLTGFEKKEDVFILELQNRFTKNKSVYIGNDIFWHTYPANEKCSPETTIILNRFYNYLLDNNKFGG